METRVRTPLGLRRSETISWGYEGKWPRIGPAVYTGRHDGPHGFAANVEASQAALAHRARVNGLARSGEWSPGTESSAA